MEGGSTGSDHVGKGGQVSQLVRVMVSPTGITHSSKKKKADTNVMLDKFLTILKTLRVQIDLNYRLTLILSQSLTL